VGDIGKTHESDDEPSCQVDPDGVREIAGLGVSFYDLELGDYWVEHDWGT
jgi:hypothetical protein